ncbi:MAG: RNA-directed DNA polymerase [Methyloprofundus sp.]|nr:RNA-directed DNA polymerase [Methyloprofundus sp.]
MNKGLPIGNLSSQFFANVYMNELDQFVKHQLKCRHYLRYVDDFILLHPQQEQLIQWHKAIEQFIQQQLLLTLRSEILLHPVQQGANFLGYTVRPHYCLVRRRVIGQLLHRLNKFQKQYIKGSQKKGWSLSVPTIAREHLSAVLSSYLGHFKHAKHYRLLIRIWQRFLWLALLFNQYACRLSPAWKPVYVSGFYSQQVYFQTCYPNAQLCIQKGYQMLSLYPKVPKNQASNIINAITLFPRHSTHEGESFQINPVYVTDKESHYFKNVESYIRAQVSRVIVKQEGYLPGGLRERCVNQLFINPGVNLCTH